MQMYGIDVIPTISWSDRKSFEWCFDGEPVGGAVAISSVGVMNSKERKALFIDGYNLHLQWMITCLCLKQSRRDTEACM